VNAAPPPRGRSAASIRPALAYARRHRGRFVRELMDFVRIPSVAAEPGHAGDVRRCAAWLAARLAESGLDARVMRTRGQPLVVARWTGAPGRPTVLVYGHYDVQPAEDPSSWSHPPFDPVVRGADLLGRGACDDKGQLWAHVKAAESLLRTAGRLPVNLLCLFEGEEESGSGGLLALLRRPPPWLRADVALVSDSPMRGPGRPAVTCALRGALSLDVEVRGPGRELHSGLYGGAVHNPLQALCEIVAALHDGRGRIAIPGLYATVPALSPAERAYLRRTGPRESEVGHDAGDPPALWGEAGFTPYERITLRPSLSVHGIRGGYAGDGAKAVIPATASASLGIRLVPGQEPEAVEALFRRRIRQLAPPSVRVRVRTRFRARPARMDRRHPAMRAAAAALRETFGREAVFLRSGGTIPVVSALGEALRAPVVLMGLALPDDRMHGPDEKMHLPNLFRGIEASIRFLHRVGGMRGADAEESAAPRHPSTRPRGAPACRAPNHPRTRT
jgi:acetylornithine deacetylase/succinyl-diaminopimelate desuccinylase-like protein